jgi:hypothetical protein
MRVQRWVTLGCVVLGLCAACAGKSQDAGDGSDDGLPPEAAGGVGGAGGAAGTGSTPSTGAQPSILEDPDRYMPGPRVVRVPQVHRTAGEQCDDERPPGNGDPAFDSSSPTCMTDADCTAMGSSCGAGCRLTCFESQGVKRCASYGGECFRDSDCSAGENGRCFNSRENRQCTYDECFSDSECSLGGPCACGGRYSGDPGPNVCMAGNCRTDADCPSTNYCSPTQGECGSYGGIIGYYCHTPSDTCVDDAECVGDSTRGAGYCMYRPELGHWACGFGQCVG